MIQLFEGKKTWALICIKRNVIDADANQVHKVGQIVATGTKKALTIDPLRATGKYETKEITVNSVG